MSGLPLELTDEQRWALAAWRRRHLARVLTIVPAILLWLWLGRDGFDDWARINFRGGISIDEGFFAVLVLPIYILWQALAGFRLIQSFTDIRDGCVESMTGVAEYIHRRVLWSRELKVCNKYFDIRNNRLFEVKDGDTVTVTFLANSHFVLDIRPV